VKAFSPIRSKGAPQTWNDPDRSAHTHPHNSRPSKRKVAQPRSNLHSEQLAGGEIEADNGTGTLNFVGPIT